MNQTLNPRRISRRQRQILSFIIEFSCERGFPPSIREIGDQVGLCSSSTTHSHLRVLEARGFIQRNTSKPRSTQVLLDPDGQPLDERFNRLRRELGEAQAELDAAYRDGLASGWSCGFNRDQAYYEALKAAGYGGHVGPEQVYGVGRGEVDSFPQAASSGGGT